MSSSSAIVGLSVGKWAAQITQEWLDLNFVENLMALFCHSIASLVEPECACASVIFTSFIDIPSLVCVDPRYLNLSTSSSVLPFIHILVNGHDLMLLMGIFRLSELISMPHSAAVFSSLSVSCWSSSSRPPSRSMSVANRKLQSGRPPMDSDN